MKKRISIICLLLAFSTILLTRCGKEGPAGRDGLDGQDGQDGQNGQNATVYYSEWFTATADPSGDWVDASSYWYFDAAAPDLTSSMVNQGVVLAYVKFYNNVFTNAYEYRPMPCYAQGANWDFLIPPSYQKIEFTSDLGTIPGLDVYFRFVAIPGTTTALKSAAMKGKSAAELRSMPYKDVCKLFNIPE